MNQCVALLLAPTDTSGDGNYYAGDTSWHSDGFGARTRLSIKLAIYLDALTADTGCVRLIPGSHRVGDAYAEALQKDIAGLQGEAGRLVPAVCVETNPGDIIIFNHNCKHASFGGSEKRRMYTMNFCRRYPEDEIEEFIGVLSGESRFWCDSIIGPEMRRTASSRRWIHLEQAVRADPTMRKLSAQKRVAMAEPSRG